MSTIELTKETFEDTVTQPGITLVDWWASWCGPCRTFAPVFQAASEEHSDVRFGKIDTEDQQELVIAVALLAGAGLRVARLGSVPVGIAQDEAVDGYDAYSILKTRPGPSRQLHADRDAGLQ